MVIIVFWRCWPVTGALSVARWMQVVIAVATWLQTTYCATLASLLLSNSSAMDFHFRVILPMVISDASVTPCLLRAIKNSALS